MSISIRIATWNISECVSTEWTIQHRIEKHKSESDLAAKFTEIINVINDNKIDFICFQEFPVIIGEAKALIDNIIAKTDLKHHYEQETYPGFLLQDSRVGISVFSRFPLYNTNFTYFKNPNVSYLSESGNLYRTFDKGLITVTINPFGKSVVIITGHAISFAPFGLNELDYPESFTSILQCIQQFDVNKDRIVLLGDFNTEHLHLILPKLYELMTDHCIGPTTISGKMEGYDFGAGRKLDYCFTNHNVLISSFKTMRTFSDHLLCLYECILPEIEG